MIPKGLAPRHYGDNTVTIEQSIEALAESNKAISASLITLADALRGFADRFGDKAEQAAERRVIIRKNGEVKTVPADEPDTLREKLAKRKATGKPEYQPRIQTTSRVIPAGQVSGVAEAPAPVEEKPAAPAPVAEAAKPAEVKAAAPAPEAPKPAEAKPEAPKAEQATEAKKENPFGVFPVDAEKLTAIDEAEKTKLAQSIFPWLQHAVTVDKAAIIGLFGKYSGKDASGMPKARNPMQLPVETFAAFLKDCAKLGA